MKRSLPCGASNANSARTGGLATVQATILVVLAMALVGSVTAQSEEETRATQGTIIALESAWNQALQQKNVKALDMVLDADLVYVEYDGKLMDKGQYMASVVTPSLLPAHVTSESMTVHVYGMTAVVTGVYREKGILNGKAYEHRERFIDTWVHRPVGWKCVASQATLIPR